MTWKDCGNNEWSSHPFRITGKYEQGRYVYRLYHLGRFLIDTDLAEDARLWAELCAMRSVDEYFPEGVQIQRSFTKVEHDIENDTVRFS